MSSDKYVSNYLLQSKCSMKIIDSPACSSGIVNENEFHFLLGCPLCNRPRVILQNAMG